MGAPPATLEHDPSTTDRPQVDALREALLRSLSTGGSQVLAALADQHGAPVAQVDREVAWLESGGLRVRRDGDRVEAERFVPLDTKTLRQALDALGEAGRRWDARVVAITGSTNADLLRQVRGSTAPHPSQLLVAELQHAGRGRLGRAWRAHPGASLCASFAIEISRRLADLQGASLACGLAVHDVVRAMGIDARLKWPNDVLVDGRKLVGILVEAHASGDATVFVIGIGINVAPVADADDSNSLPPIDLESAGAVAPDRHALAASLAVALEARLALLATAGFESCIADWNAADAFRDRRVVLHSPDGRQVVGIERGIDRDGALLVEIDGETRRHLAGDVSVRPA